MSVLRAPSELRPWSGGRRHPRRCGARPGALAGSAEASPRRPRVWRTEQTPSAGLFGPPHVRAPSVSELPGQLTTSVEREVDVPGGAERAPERSWAVRRRHQGTPARLVDRTGVRSGSARPLESVHWGTHGGVSASSILASSRNFPRIYLNTLPRGKFLQQQQKKSQRTSIGWCTS